MKPIYLEIMILFKSYLKIKYKSFIQLIFKYFYGSVKIATSDEIKTVLTVKNTEIKKSFYKTYRVKNCRLFTTSVHDQSVIVNNKLIEGPSFQLRVKKNDKLYARNNGNINENGNKIPWRDTSALEDINTIIQYQHMNFQKLIK